MFWNKATPQLKLRFELTIAVMSLNVCIHVCAFCMLSGINRRRNHVFSITSARYSRGNVTLSQFLKLAIKMLSKVRIKNIKFYLIIENLIDYRCSFDIFVQLFIKTIIFTYKNISYMRFILRDYPH